MPEFCAPALGNKPNIVTIDADIPENANGVLYALGGAARRPYLLRRRRHISYEYNLFISSGPRSARRTRLPAGRGENRGRDELRRAAPAGPLDITVRVGGGVVAQGQVPVSAPLLFTANDCLDIGECLGSPVSMDYYDRAPFPFNGTIDRVHVAYT